MSAQYTLVDGEDGRTLTVFIDGREPKVIRSEGQIDSVMELVLDPYAAEEDVIDAMDTTVAVGRRLTPLSERVSVGDGRVYFDGTVVDSSITRQILRFLDEGIGDWMPLVRFLEKLATNPSEHSRTQLYGWLRERDFTITPDGDFVAYKGVRWDGDTPVSIHAGPGIVNGRQVHGHLDNSPGNRVEIDRTTVDFDPARGCSRGLHVGSWDYAASFGGGSTLKVVVNPRDVVSVPTDCEWAKVRVCRYDVLDATKAPVTSTVYDYEDDFGWSDEFYALGD